MVWYEKGFVHDAMRVLVIGFNMPSCALQCVPCIVYNGHRYDHVFVHVAMRVSVNGCNPTCT